jgi:hypothetical protein
MNRAIKDATVKAFHYENLESLKAHVLAFVTAYQLRQAPRTRHDRDRHSEFQSSLQGLVLRHTERDFFSVPKRRCGARNIERARQVRPFGREPRLLRSGAYRYRRRPP